MKKMAEMFDFRISEHYLPFVSPKIFDNTSKYTACPDPPYMLMLLKTDLFGQPLIFYCLWQCFLKPQKEHNPLNQKINSADEQVSRLNEKIKTAAGKKAQRKG